MVARLLIIIMVFLLVTVVSVTRLQSFCVVQMDYGKGGIRPGHFVRNIYNLAYLTEYCREEFEKFTTFLTSKKCRNWPVFR